MGIGGGALPGIGGGPRLGGGGGGAAMFLYTQKLPARGTIAIILVERNTCRGSTARGETRARD